MHWQTEKPLRPPSTSFFCAVDMKQAEIRALEESYAKLECPVISNNSAHRWTPDVPMVIPEVNPEHLQVIRPKNPGWEPGAVSLR